MAEGVMSVSSASYTFGYKSDLTTGAKIQRKYLRMFVKKLDGSFFFLGKGVEESAMEMDVDSETKTDIGGNKETTVNSVTITQSFDPMEVRVGDEIDLRLIDIVRREAWEELSAWEILITWGFLEDTATKKTIADMYKNCTITVDGIATGTSYIGMPLTVTLSGGTDKQRGTVDDWLNPTTFTADVVATP